MLLIYDATIGNLVAKKPVPKHLIKFTKRPNVKRQPQNSWKCNPYLAHLEAVVAGMVTVEIEVNVMTTATKVGVHPAGEIGEVMVNKVVQIMMNGTQCPPVAEIPILMRKLTLKKSSVWQIGQRKLRTALHWAWVDLVGVKDPARPSLQASINSRATVMPPFRTPRPPPTTAVGKTEAGAVALTAIQAADLTRPVWATLADTAAPAAAPA